MTQNDDTRRDIHRTDDSGKEAANYLFWMLLIQGVSWLAMGIIVAIYPVSLFLMAMIAFLWVGITTLVIAARVRRYWESMPEAYRRSYAASA